MIRLRSGWGWLRLPACAGEPELGLPLPPALALAWGARLRRWNDAGRPAPDDDARRALEVARDALLGERYLEPRRPWPARCGLTSQQIPALVRMPLHALAAHRASDGDGAGALPADAGPAWPHDPTADWLRARVFGGPPPAWRSATRFALSHDLDTPASWPIARRMARLQADLGHRATYFVVGRDLWRARRLVRELRDLGHEVGLHGLVHDFQLAYLRGGALARRLDKLARLARELGGAGFRAPALLSSPALRRGLAARGFRYDSSLPASDRDSLLGPRRGCGTTRAFVLDGLPQLPLAAPLEDRLLMAGARPEQIVARYDEALVRPGLCVIGTHLEPHTGGREDVFDALACWLRDTPEDAPRSQTLAACVGDRSGRGRAGGGGGGGEAMEEGGEGRRSGRC